MYYLSVLSIFKNETMNLRMWLDHYIWQGVEHFYLIDNGSTDNPLNILQPYIANGIVTYTYQPKPYQQVQHYRNMFDRENLKDATYWLAVCDLDEFFYGVDKKLSIKIRTLESQYNVIYCNWLMFGHENLVDHPHDIRTSIVHRVPGLHQNTKYIFKTRAIKDSSQIWIHALLNYSHPAQIRIANQLIRLNHYPIQSLEFFKKVKMTRGDVCTSTSNNIRDIHYFNSYNENAGFKDETLKNLIESPPSNYNK